MGASANSRTAVLSAIVALAAAGDGRSAKVFVRQLAKSSGVSDRTVFRRLAELEADGVITREWDRPANRIPATEPVLVVTLTGVAP
jgi:CTP-dependent riboflavin kinase